MDARPGYIVEPPRNVPLSVRLRVLFGGAVNQIGWIMIGFGMIFVWIFGGAADLAGVFVFNGDLGHADGAVTRCEQTSFSEGGDDHSSGTPVYAIRYSFTDAVGATREGVSYGTGTQYEPGETVSIEYTPDDSSRSRIAGLRSAPFGAWALFVAIFPLVGALFLAGGLRSGLRADRLLREGRLALARFVSSRATNTRVNNRVVQELTFEFTCDAGVTRTLKTKTSTPENLRDEEREPLLYDPGDPDRAVLLDSLPGSPRIDEFGALAPSSTRGALLCLIIPLMTIVGHGAYLASRLTESS